MARRQVISKSASFADPAADAVWPLLKVPAGAGSITVVGAYAVCDTSLDATSANGRAVSLLNGGSTAASTDVVASTAAAISGVDGTGVDAVWTLTVEATAGNFIIGDGDETHTCAYNISAANLQTELRTWASGGTTGVTVTGGPGDETGSTPYVITYDADNAAFDPELVLTAVDDTEGTPLSGGDAAVAIVETTAGVDPSLLEDWTAATPKPLTLSTTAGACVIDEGEWLCVKYDETGADAFKNLSIVVDIVEGLV